jgi:hypothetical protein
VILLTVSIIMIIDFAGRREMFGDFALLPLEDVVYDAFEHEEDSHGDEGLDNAGYDVEGLRIQGGADKILFRRVLLFSS